MNGVQATSFFAQKPDGFLGQVLWKWFLQAYNLAEKNSDRHSTVHESLLMLRSHFMHSGIWWTTFDFVLYEPNSISSLSLPLPLPLIGLFGAICPCILLCNISNRLDEGYLFPCCCGNVAPFALRAKVRYEGNIQVSTVISRTCFLFAWVTAVRQSSLDTIVP